MMFAVSPSEPLGLPLASMMFAVSTTEFTVASEPLGLPLASMMFAVSPSEMFSASKAATAMSPESTTKATTVTHSMVSPEPDAWQSSSWCSPWQLFWLSRRSTEAVDSKASGLGDTMEGATVVALVVDSGDIAVAALEAENISEGDTVNIIEARERPRGSEATVNSVVDTVNSVGDTVDSVVDTVNLVDTVNSVVDTVDSVVDTMVDVDSVVDTVNLVDTENSVDIVNSVVNTTVNSKQNIHLK